MCVWGGGNRHINPGSWGAQTVLPSQERLQERASELQARAAEGPSGQPGYCVEEAIWVEMKVSITPWVEGSKWPLVESELW